MVQSHNIFDTIGKYLDDRNLKKDEGKDPIESFIKGVKEFRNIWKDKETS